MLVFLLHKVIDLLTKVISNRPSSFGISRYVLISNEPFPDNVLGAYGDVLREMIIHLDTRPQNMRRVDYNQVLGSSVTDLAGYARHPAAISGHFTYSLNVSGSIQGFPLNVI